MFGDLVGRRWILASHGSDRDENFASGTAIYLPNFAAAAAGRRCLVRCRPVVGNSWQLGAVRRKPSLASGCPGAHASVTRVASGFSRQVKFELMVKVARFGV